MSGRHRTRRRAMVAMLVGAALGAAACGVPRDGYEAIGSDELPDRLQPESDVDVPSTNQAAPWIAEVFWVREDTLVPVAVTLGGPIAPEPLIEVLAAGPTWPAARENLRTAFQDDTLVRSTDIARGTATVDLDERFATAVGADQVRALGQLVFSLTSLPDVDRVRFTVGGEDAAVPTPAGDVVQRPVTRNDYMELIDLSSLIEPG